MLTPQEAIDLHKIIYSREPEARIDGANWFFDLSGQDLRIKTVQSADEVLYSIYLTLLDQRKTSEAALLLWGDDEIFDPRPDSVQRIWRALDAESKILIPGGGDQGKSYTPAAWSVLFWTHDPAWTSVKVLSVTSVHAAANVMSTIKTFHEASAIKLPGRLMETKIDMGDGNPRSSIIMTSIPQGKDMKGRLRGFHPVPRIGPPHPLFGKISRIAVFIDEGEDVPEGLWEGLENILSSENKQNKDHLKIYSGANPKKRESAFAQRCEFPGGWQNFDIERDFEWTGPEAMGGWKVIRIDPLQSENVRQKAEVYPGMMTYDGFMNYVRKGLNSPPYYTFARGAWPESSAEFRITPQEFFTNSRGTLTFEADVVPIASLDPAFAEGGDAAMLTTARYGTAIGFQPIEGPYQPWDGTQGIWPHKAIQYEQQFPLPKDNAQIMALNLIQILKNLRVRGEWFIMDRTGNGMPFHDMLKYQYGDIMGVMWSEAATEGRILETDTLTAEESYSGIITEMAFAFAQWLQAGYIKFAPMMVISDLVTQATNRRYYFASNGLMKAEDKLSYKATASGRSPDRYDSAIMIPHLVRMRDAQRASILPQSEFRAEMREDTREDSFESGFIDQRDFISVL